MNLTPNYELPQYEGNDETSWYDFNKPFETIDTQMKANADAAETAQQTADSNTNSIANLTESLNSTIGRVTKNEQNITADKQQITLNTTHLNEHDTAIQTLDTEVTAIQQAIGSDETGSGTGTISGDITDLQNDVAGITQRLTTAEGNIGTNADNIGNLSRLNTSEKNNLVEAINSLSGTGKNNDHAVSLFAATLQSEKYTTNFSNSQYLEPNKNYPVIVESQFTSNGGILFSYLDNIVVTTASTWDNSTNDAYGRRDFYLSVPINLVFPQYTTKYYQTGNNSIDDSNQYVVATVVSKNIYATTTKTKYTSEFDISVLSTSIEKNAGNNTVIKFHILINKLSKGNLSVGMTFTFDLHIALYKFLKLLTQSAIDTSQITISQGDTGLSIPTIGNTDTDMVKSSKLAVSASLFSNGDNVRIDSNTIKL